MKRKKETKKNRWQSQKKVNEEENTIRMENSRKKT